MDKRETEEIINRELSDEDIEIEFYSGDATENDSKSESPKTFKEKVKKFFDTSEKQKAAIFITLGFIAVVILITSLSMNNRKNDISAATPGQASKGEAYKGEGTEDDFDDTKGSKNSSKKDSKEKETVDVSKLEVSEKDAKDDAQNKKDNQEVNEGFQSINSASVSTIPSTMYDKARISYGIDVSKHQGDIDWAKVKASGVTFAFIRVGFRGYENGKLCKDTSADKNIREAQANGINVGVYFFSQAVNEREALEEASLTLDYIRGYNLELPVVIDWETAKGYRTYSMGGSQLTSVLSTFCDTVGSYGYTPMVYMCQSDFTTRINTTDITNKYLSWLAWYFDEYNHSNRGLNVFTYGDKIPDVGFDYYIWQYSSNGAIDGINEKVDMNIMIDRRPAYEPQMTITNKEIITNLNVPVNIRDGVTASDIDGNDQSAAVITTVYTPQDVEIPVETAFTLPGSYRIHYEYADSSGITFMEDALLYVRDYPIVYWQGNIWSGTNTQTYQYVYDEGVSVNSNYNNIVNAVKNLVTAQCYEKVINASDPINLEGNFEGFEKIILGNTMVSGYTDVVYTVNDGRGLSVTKIIKVEVIRNQQHSTNAQTTPIESQTVPVTTVPETTTMEETTVEEKNNTLANGN